jgi:hypothetical protein
MIRLRNKEILGKVKKSIAKHQKDWKKHDAEEGKQLTATVGKQVEARRTRSWFVPAADAGKEAECPACGNPGWMTGEVVGIDQPRAGEDERDARRIGVGRVGRVWE